MGLYVRLRCINQSTIRREISNCTPLFIENKYLDVEKNILLYDLKKSCFKLRKDTVLNLPMAKTTLKLRLIPAIILTPYLVLHCSPFIAIEVRSSINKLCAFPKAQMSGE